MEITAIVLGLLSMIITSVWLYSSYLQDKKNHEFRNRVKNFNNDNIMKTKSNQTFRILRKYNSLRRF